MSTEEQRAHRAAYMRKWRAANPERNRENNRLHKVRWRAEHPGEAATYESWWRKQNPESAKRITKKHIEKRKAARAADPEPFRASDRARVRAVAGIPEHILHENFAAEHPEVVWLDRIRPDFYIPDNGFVEIKRALPYQAYIWRQQSAHFPGLFFMQDSGRELRANGQLRRNLDTQIALCPRPLTVIVYHALTGEELARTVFH